MKNAEKKRKRRSREPRCERYNLQYREELEDLRGAEKGGCGSRLFLIKAEICLVSELPHLERKKKEVQSNLISDK